MPLPEPKLIRTEEGPVARVKVATARLDAERAINEFKTQSLAQSAEKVREAYARLMVGRGFKRARPSPLMNADSATVSEAGNDKGVPGAKPSAPAAPEARPKKPIPGGMYDTRG